MAQSPAVLESQMLGVWSGEWLTYEAYSSGFIVGKKKKNLKVKCLSAFIYGSGIPWCLWFSLTGSLGIGEFFIGMGALVK